MGALETVIAGEFHFDPDDVIYRNHFPGKPVVPGSLIIDAFMRVVGSAAGNRRREWAVENFRFRRFIAPGRYAFRVAGQSDGSMQCILYDGDRTVVTGKMNHSAASC
jgi:3-hydroxyacyl-[acyl-carrier-protein] dehydratase